MLEENQNLTRKSVVARTKVHQGKLDNIRF